MNIAQRHIGAAYRDRTVALWFRAGDADTPQSPSPTDSPATTSGAAWMTSGSSTAL